MSIKRKLKTIYKKMLVKVGRSKAGNSVSSFISGTASILENEVGRANREKISARLMVERLVGTNATSDNFKGDYTERLELREKEKADNSSREIKVRIMHCHSNTLNAIETISESFQEDPKFDLKVILMHESGNSSELAKQMEYKGFPYLFDYDYDLQDDRPDIVLFYQLEYRYPDKLYEAYIYAKLVVLVPLTLTTIWYGERSISRMHLDMFKPGLVFATDLVMDKMKANASDILLKKMVPPQIDTVYRRLITEKRYPDGWEKLKNKKVMFYMTDHGLRHYFVSDEVSFDLYISLLMDFARREENKDIGLIIRPHFALINELLAHFWSVSDYEALIKYCNDSPNIVWDDTTDFMNGLSVCDAILSDLNTSVTYFSLASMKPIAITLRYDMFVQNYNKEFTDELYEVHSEQDLIDFMNMVKRGEDPKLDRRKTLFEKLIAPFDGESGKRVKNDIEKEYYSKIKGV